MRFTCFALPCSDGLIFPSQVYRQIEVFDSFFFNGMNFLLACRSNLLTNLFVSPMCSNGLNH